VIIISEISTSLVGLPVVSYVRFLGLIMGVWFLCAGLVGKISAWIGSLIVDFEYMSVFFW